MWKGLKWYEKTPYSVYHEMDELSKDFSLLFIMSLKVLLSTIIHSNSFCEVLALHLSLQARLTIAFCLSFCSTDGAVSKRDQCSSKSFWQWPLPLQNAQFFKVFQVTSVLHESRIHLLHLFLIHIFQNPLCFCWSSQRSPNYQIYKIILFGTASRALSML